MPPNPLPFRCGTPGCNRSYEKADHLRQHTKDSHPKPKPPPPRSASSGPPPSRPPASKSPSKPETYKCGAKGCEQREPFLQYSSLVEHTAQAHPKAKKKTPSGPSAVQISLPALNTGPSSGYTPVASDSQEELLQRVRQLELRQVLVDKSTLKVGEHFVDLAEDVIRSSTSDRRISFLARLQERVQWMSKHDIVCSLAYSAKFRDDIRALLQDVGYNDLTKIQKVFTEDDKVISHLFREVIHSAKEEILHLSDEKATGFMDALRKCIMASDDDPFARPAHRLLRNLCTATKEFPPTLFLELDSVNTNRQIGGGGYADIFLGRYKGQDIALKRLRIIQQDPNEMTEISKYLLQEVLTWANLKQHVYILPFLGLDKNTFESYPPCIVTPYMRNGTMDSFVKNRNGMFPDKRDQLLFETAQGLAYLHSQNIVHGDLRGGNVLIDDGEHAQLADFGLAIVTDATRNSTKERGSSRWMAPELHDHELEFKRTEASDVYAFACLCIEIYTGAQPFWNIRQDMTVVLLVLDQKRPPRPSSSGPPDGTRAMSDGLWAIVERCWAHKPLDRPVMKEVLGLIRSS
ncbi:kinase-like domain-containing protein [Mycena albidolilacea]|uniref:Kinase-like domain-containing protein n=1 Tax=Mycena albidolilacea TaxID=1033008 RepID=A0AAD6YXH1_9AGAR|nr:kinase-like domain-containing protein [Mycena albidolilacea]